MKTKKDTRWSKMTAEQKAAYYAKRNERKAAKAAKKETKAAAKAEPKKPTPKAAPCKKAACKKATPCKKAVKPLAEDAGTISAIRARAALVSAQKEWDAVKKAVEEIGRTMLGLARVFRPDVAELRVVHKEEAKAK